MTKSVRTICNGHFLFVFLFLIFGAGQADAQKTGEQVFRGTEAIEQLQNDGQFESLKEAYENARKKGETQNSSDLVTLTGPLSASNGALNDNFGKTVEVLGDYAFIGAPNAAGGKGAVYVFYRDMGTWVFDTELTASDGAVGDNFGASLSSLLPVVAIGAPGKDTSLGPNVGAVYVF